MQDSKESIEVLARELREKDEELMIRMGLKPPSVAFSKLDDDHQLPNHIQSATNKKKRKFGSGQSVGSAPCGNESLESQRQKFFDNFICSINTGSDVVINEAIRASCVPNLVYREQYVHFVPDTLIYRELPSAKLLADYLHKLTVAVPDGVIILQSQTLKTRRDGSAYMMARIRFRGSYTYRLVTTNWSTDVRQFLRHSKTLKPTAALSTSSVMTQQSAFHPPSIVDSKTKAGGSANQDSSSDRKTLQIENVPEKEQQLTDNNETLKEDGGFLMIPPTLRSHPWMSASTSSSASSYTSFTHPQSEGVTMGNRDDLDDDNEDSLLDEEQLFQDLYSALVANENGIGHSSGHDSSDTNDKLHKPFTNYSNSMPVICNTSSSSTITASSSSIPKSNNVHSMEIFRTSCDHLPNNEPLFMHSPLTRQPQPVVYTAIEREYNYRRKRPLNASSAISGDLYNMPTTSMTLPMPVSNNFIHAYVTNIPPSTDHINVAPFKNSNNDTYVFNASSNTNATKDVDTSLINPISTTVNNRTIIAPATTIPVVENYKQNALEIERHYFITADMIKVATEKSEFLIMDKFPKPLHFDTSATYIAYFEPHSPLVYRLDAYKRDNTLCRDEEIEQYSTYASSSSSHIVSSK